MCQQIAQNLAVICACLPYFHPFIIGLLAQTEEPDTVSFDRDSKHIPRSSFGPMSSHSSQASTTRLTQKTPEPYCRPLVTWGLDHVSIHRHSHSRSASHFPPNTARPVFTPRPPSNVFNRLIDVPIPQSRPPTSTSATDPLSMPPTLQHVGVLPFIDWDSESGSSRRSSPMRQPTSDYVFNRQKVVSVSEENYMYDDGSKKFAPPLPSPRVPKRPPRAF